MSTVIDRQLQSLHASACDAPRAQFELEDLLGVAVGLFDHLKAAVQRWQSSVKDWESQSWIDQARQFEDRYRKLQQTFNHIAEVLAHAEGAGSRFGGGQAFRQAKLDLELLCQLSVDRMLKSDDAFRQGKRRTMAEVRDELRRRLGA